MSSSTLSRDDRGASEVAGYILLVGLVITAAGFTLMLGSGAISGMQAERDATAVRSVLENIDTELSTLAASSDAPTVQFDFSSSAANPSMSASEQLSVVRSGRLNVSIFDGSGQRCTAISHFGTIQFEQGSRIVAYQGGGIWSGATDGGSAMISPPDVAFRNGSLDVSLVNVTGHLNDGLTEGRVNLTRTRAANLDHESDLTTCEAVDRVQVTVNSSYHEAWGEYLSTQTGVTPTAVGSNSIRIELTANELPARTDMANNTVVNLSQSNPPDYMTELPGAGATIDDDASHPDSITVEKGTNNSYLVSATPLTQRPPRISQIRSLAAANVSGRSRPPVDVVFVMDESGSMDGSKIQNAKDAAKVAVGTMNTSIIGDRASIVGYTANPNQRFVNKSDRWVYFSNESDQVNDSIETLEADGSTDLAGGLNQSLAALSFRENHRNAHVILLTDGQNSPGLKCNDYTIPRWEDCDDFFDDRTLNAARIAAEQGVTVHTFGYGSGADESLLREIADITGGNYSFASSGDDLEDAFESTVGGFTSKRDYVTRTPLSTNFTGGGQVHPPQIVGDTDPLASNKSNGKTFLNINDPTAPTLFSHSFRVDDGDPVVINATTFDCAQDGWSRTGRTVQTGGRTLPIARCSEIVSTNQSLNADRINVHNSGDPVTPLKNNDVINQSLQRYNASGQLDLASNQVLVELDFQDQGEFENDLVLLYEIGLSESDVRGSDVVNLQETAITMD